MTRIRWAHVTAALYLCSRAAGGAQPDPDWLAPMKAVNAAFDGNPCYIAQFGDSITYSMAFWAPVGWMEPDQFLTADDGLPKRPAEKRWRDTLKGINGKGPEHANYSGWTVRNLLAAVPAVLKRENPEVAIIMIGTNDTAPGGPPADYGPNLEKLIQLCLDSHCIPILNTIPPKRGCMDGVEKTNAIIRELAAKFHLPLVDYFAEIVKRQPDRAWEGTLIDKDGVHPTGGDVGVFSDANLSRCGFALRTWLNFRMVRELYFRILSAPKPFIEPVGTVLPIRAGVRCEVVADTQVSAYADANENETVWNWGGARRLKCHGWEEYALLDFDTSKARGMAISKATLYLSRTEQCVINVAGVSTISAKWSEGKGNGKPGTAPRPEQGRDSRGGATFSHAVYPDVSWAGPRTDFRSAVFGHGGSLWAARATGWATNAAGQAYYSIDLPLDIAQALLVEEDSKGLVISDEKGQRQFQSTYRRVPNANHFIHSRESPQPCFLVLEGSAAPASVPAAVMQPAATAGTEAGELLLSWVCPADAAGGSVLGYVVHVSKEKLNGRNLDDRNRLPRCRTWRPEAPGSRQQFPLYDLEPGVEYWIAVTAYDRFGHRSEPVIFTGRPRAAASHVLPPAPPAATNGSPLLAQGLRLWAVSSCEKVNPLTGNAMSEGTYGLAAAAGSSRAGNETWDGRRHAVTLTAGRNDFAGFQFVIENTSDQPANGVEVTCTALERQTEFSEMNRYVRLSRQAPERFHSLMRDLSAADPGGASSIFAAVNHLNGLAARQAGDAEAFFREMEAVRRRSEAEYRNTMELLGGGARAADTISAANVELFWEWSVKARTGQWYPDALVPLSGALEIPNLANRVPGQKVQALYVDVWVPHRTPPGRYRGELQVRSAAGAEASVPVELTVWDFELPDRLGFVCDMNGYENPPADDWEGVLNTHRLAHRNRLNVNIVPYSHGGNWNVPQMAMEVRGKGKGATVVSFDRFDRHYGPLLDGRAFSRNPRAAVPVPVLYLGLYENWPATLAGGFTFDQTATHLDVRQDFTQEYKDTFVAVCRQIGAHLKKQGYDRTDFQVFLNNKYQYAPETTFWLLDEPMFRDDFLVIQLFGDLVREGFRDCGPITVDYRIDCSRVEEARGMMNKVDTMVFSQDNVRQYPGLARAFLSAYEPRKPGQRRKAWEYGGAGLVTSSPVSTRAWIVETWLGGRDGLLPWLSYGTEESWTAAESARDAIFYPASRRWGYNGCYGSLRMKAFRDGQQDAEYLAMLGRKLGATRRELAELLQPHLALQATVAVDGSRDVRAQDAGNISYRGLTPDTLVRLRRIIGANLAGAP